MMRNCLTRQWLLAGAVMVVWVISMGGSLRLKYAQIRAVSARGDVTLTLWALYVVFAVPWADGIKVLQKQRRPLMTHASGKSAVQNR